VSAEHEGTRTHLYFFCGFLPLRSVSKENHGQPEHSFSTPFSTINLRCSYPEVNDKNVVREIATAMEYVGLFDHLKQ
jgi:hypothetical protein